MKFLVVLAAILPILNTSASILRRGVCDEYCTTFQQLNTGCGNTSNYYECLCKAENIALLDNCFACLVLNIQTNDGLNSVVSGGQFGLDSSATVESVIAKGEAAHATAVNDCAAHGFANLVSNASPASNEPAASAPAASPTGGASGGDKANDKGSASVNQVGGALAVAFGAIAVLV